MPNGTFIPSRVADAILCKWHNPLRQRLRVRNARAQGTDLHLAPAVHLQGVRGETLDYSLPHEPERIKEVAACQRVTMKWVKFNNQIPGAPQEVRVVLQEFELRSFDVAFDQV